MRLTAYDVKNIFGPNPINRELISLSVSYNNRAQAGTVETVVLTGSRNPTPIAPGLMTIHSTVTVVYAIRQFLRDQIAEQVVHYRSPGREIDLTSLHFTIENDSDSILRVTAFSNASS